MYAQKFSNSFSRAFKIIVGIWLLSASLAMPYLFVMGVYYEYPEYVETKACSIVEVHREKMRIIIQLTVLFLFMIPMTLISIMYVLIGITLWKSQKKNRSLSQTVAKSTKKLLNNNSSNNDNDKQLNSENLINSNESKNNRKKVKRIKNNENNVIVSDTNMAREAITQRARQSRRDVVKMLCKFYLYLTFI